MLRLDKFKKVAEDDNVVTMRHDDGHEMKIFLNGLKSKLQREQLKRLKLAEGGSVESGKQRFDHEKGVHRPVEETDNPKYGSWQRRSKAGKHINEMTHPDHAPDSREKRDNNNLQNKAKDEHYKVLGEIVSNKNKDRKYLADGGDPGPDGDYMTNSTPFYDGSKEKWTQYPQEQNRAPASDSNPPDDSQDQSSPDSGHTTNVIINPTPAQQPQVQTAPPTPQAAQANDTQPQGGQPQSAAAQYGQQPVKVDQPDVNGSTINNLSPSGNVNPYAVQRNSQVSAQNQRDINISQGKAQAQVQQGYNDAVAQTAQRDQDNFNKYILAPTEQFKQYMNQNPINPKAYQENMNTGQKVSTAIGLFLGGFKQGLVGGNNPAMDFLNHQIDRDINGQKARADQQRTIWGAYRDLYGDSNVTNNLARASMLDLYNNKMKQVALQLNTPQAMANLQLGGGAIAIEKQKAMKDAMTDLSASPGFVSPLGSQVGVGVQKNQIQRSIGPDAQLLSPSADQTYKRLLYTNTPDIQANLPEIQKEYLQARKAEVLLNRIPTIMSELQQAAQDGGKISFAQRKVGPDQIGEGAGHAASAGGNNVVTGLVNAASSFSSGIPQTQANRKYYEAMANLQREIRALLPNAGFEEVSGSLHASAPEYGDSQEVLNRKINGLQAYIRQSAYGPLLEQYGLWKKK